MSVREKLETNPKVAMAGAGAVIFIALVLIVINVAGGGSDANSTKQAKGFFTVDDGKSWFVDDNDKVPPYEKDGKTAYRAVVLTCDGGTTKFVSYLIRYTPEYKAMMEAATRKPSTLPSGEETAEGTEVKSPGTGDKGWVKQSSPEAEAITTTKCPKGDPANVEAVKP